MSRKLQAETFGLPSTLMVEKTPDEVVLFAAEVEKHAVKKANLDSIVNKYKGMKSIFICPRETCRATEDISTRADQRCSADEGMWYFCHCKHCGRDWVQKT